MKRMMGHYRALVRLVPMLSRDLFGKCAVASVELNAHDRFVIFNPFELNTFCL